MSDNLTRIWLIAGTVVHYKGIPVKLVSDTELETHPGNLALMDLEVYSPKAEDHDAKS